MKSKIVAALLAFFFGGLGIHKFYLGKPIQGIIYILFCWTFIPGLISFFEAIIYLLTSDADFERKYCPRPVVVVQQTVEKEKDPNIL